MSRTKKVLVDDEALYCALIFINDYINTFSYPPSVREIGIAAGYSSSSSGQKIVDAMRKRKLIYIDTGIARGMRISEIGIAELASLAKQNA